MDVERNSLETLALSPLMILLDAMLKALILSWPVMILFGNVHSHVPWVPPYGWIASFWIVALISVLIPGRGRSGER
jgi:hypothetical protein